MREVSKDEFFAFMGPLNVNPRSGRDLTLWETPARQVLGKSVPGYMAYGNDGRAIPKQWFIAEAGRF